MSERADLIELRDRIADLPLGEQLYLFELVFAEYRRRYKEEQLRQVAAIKELLELEKQQRAQSIPPEAKREAG